MREIVYDYLLKKLGKDVELEVIEDGFYIKHTKIIKIRIDDFYFTMMIDATVNIFDFIRRLNGVLASYYKILELQESSNYLCNLLSEVLDEEVKYDGEFERRYFYIGDDEYDDDKKVLFSLNKRGRVEFWSDYIFEPEILIEIAEFYRDNY